MHKVVDEDGASPRSFDFEADSQCSEDDDPEEFSFVSLLCNRWVLLGIVITVFSWFIARPVAVRIAEEVVHWVGITVDSVDVGVIQGSHDFSPTVVARVRCPSPVSASTQIRHASIWAHLYGESEQVRIGLLTLPAVKLQAFQDLHLNLTAQLHVEDIGNFGRAAEDVVLAETTTWTIKGSMDVEVWVLGLIPFYLSGIQLNKDIVLQGMAGFSQESNPITMREIVSAKGLMNAVELDVSVNLHNPSFVYATIQEEIMFGVETRGHRFGIAAIRGMRLVPGDNVVTLQFTLTSTGSNDQAIQDFLAGYVRAEVQAVTVVGNVRSSLDPVLGGLLQHLRVDMQFKPPPTQFVERVTARVSPTGLNAKVKVYNPLPRAITLGDLDLRIYLHEAPDTMIFDLDSSLSQTAVPGTVLEPKQSTDVYINLSIMGAQIGALAELETLINGAAEGNLVVLAKGPVTFTIQPSYKATVPYAVDNLTTHLGWCIICI